MEKPDINNLSSAELEELLKQKREQEQKEERTRRDAYEAIRQEVVSKISQKVHSVAEEAKGLFDFVVNETSAFYEIMQEYGQAKRENQLSYTLQDNTFKIEVKTNKVKKFDERADIAASRLIEFLDDWISNSQKGENDPMYQLAMTLLERNKYGDLDYKSISKLYELESQFNDKEYSDIMQLFKESNKVEGTATNFYFYEKNQYGVWRKIEVSFNRL